MDIRNLPGGVPEPEELFGRNHLIDTIWNQLSGTNILLVAPRRFGKTGIMRHLLKRPRSGFLAVYLNVEDISSPEGFVTGLLALLLEHDKSRKLITSIKGIPKQVVDSLRSAVDEVGVETFRVKLRDWVGSSWELAAKKLILEMEKLDETVLFIIDEFPQMIDNVAREHGNDAARSLLSWFRSLRLKQKDHLRKFRFVIAGSTSIDMVLRRLEVADKLNDCFRVPVEPLEHEDAVSLIAGLAQSHGLRFSQVTTDAFLDLIGPPVPYFIHLLMSQLILESKLKEREVTPDDVAAIYHRRLLGPTCHKYFDYYRQRLKRYGTAAERAAIAILREIAAAPSGRVSESSLYDVYRKARKKGDSDVEFREIMADLECDWYVSLDTATNEYYFFMDVMKAWWDRFYRRVEPRRE